MRIVIFGASGATGQQLIAQGLHSGLEVTAFVRNAQKLESRPGLRIVSGDVYNADQVAKAITGQDAVLSALGPRTLGKSDLLERAMANILGGMKRHGVKRLIVLGAAGAFPDSAAMRYQPWFARTMGEFLLNVVLKNPMAAQRAQHGLIAASGTDYTIVEPPRLTNGPATGKYRVQADALPPNVRSTPRADVADFMLRQLSDSTWLRKTPYLGV